MNARTTVIIVGGGMTGLSAAAFLAAQHVDCLLVERHADLLIHPRARGITPRSVEVFRQLGVEEAIMAARGLDVDQAKSIMLRADTLASPDFLPIEPDPAETFAGVSPCVWAPIDQDRLELILRDRARELGAEIRFGTELINWDQDGDRVTATIRGGGEETLVEADYLIAADGWDSPVRESLGIPVPGPGVLARCATVVFEADLAEALGGREVMIAYLNTPRPGSVLVRVGESRWTFATPYFPDQGESFADYTEQGCVELVRAAVGLPELDVTLLAQIPSTGTKILDFTVSARVAQRFREGRVLLAGDAAHTMPPTGGLGGSTGIQDAHNLAWKLAAVIRGRARPSFLDTYEQERRPVALLTFEQALARGRARGLGGQRPSEGDALIEPGALIFGYRYRSSAIAGDPEDSTPVVPATELHGQAGTRAPHVALLRDGMDLSTLDLYGKDFVLLAGRDADGWAQAAKGLPLTVYRFGRDLTENGAPLEAAHGIGADGAVLVRPDGFVAWRSAAAGADPETRLREVMTAILG